MSCTKALIAKHIPQVLLIALLWITPASAQNLDIEHKENRESPDIESALLRSQGPTTEELNLDKVENSAFLFAIPEPTGVNFAATSPVTLPESGFIGRAEFTTVSDVTGREFTLGIKQVTLAQSASSSNVITTTNVISFNKTTSGEFAGIQLHLDTQIETPAAQNNKLTIPEQKAGDTIQLQLFAPMAAGKQTYGYEIELDLPGKTFSNYISNISGTDFSGASLFPTPDRPILSALLLSTPVVPANGYLGQIDLQVANTLESETTLIVKTASMAGLNRQQDLLDVSNAMISFSRRVYPGDFDNDLDVDFADFLAFATVLGLSSSDANYDARMDMNSDGIINFADFLVFVGVFGTTYDQPIFVSEDLTILGNPSIIGESAGTPESPSSFIRISGNLDSQSGLELTGLKVRVRVLGENGTPLGISEDVCTPAEIAPGGSCTFLSAVVLANVDFRDSQSIEITPGCDQGTGTQRLIPVLWPDP